jgi:hypothetical protein
MIRRNRRNAPAVLTPPPSVHGVRMLRSDAELQEAVERARAFESRGSDEYRRRVGSYDRLLSDANSALVADPFTGIPAGEGRCGPDDERAHKGLSLVSQSAHRPVS